MVTKVSSKKDDDDKFLHVSNLRSLIDMSSAKTSDAKQLFRCRVSVNAILPDPLEETKTNDFTQYLKIYNTKTGSCRQLSSKSDKPKKDEKLCIFVQLICKDASI